ncbi:hypothetical protein PENTCL1PPCAC_20525, partial [Pristionchus entomophagus]
LQDITAHLRIDRHATKPVVSNTQVNGTWIKQERKEQPLEGELPSKGWWRVDVIKVYGRSVRDRININVI